MKVFHSIEMLESDAVSSVIDEEESSFPIPTVEITIRVSLDGVLLIQRCAALPKCERIKRSIGSKECIHNGKKFQLRNTGGI
ncbi:hypothetical protein T11_14552 [Trichinella zimbabwensis]|uniref:Uncharacterized protein n=1 Tax=Trichinella zimbabwensis TaxID=268475 RepID=A0A0V1I3X4_9BILA|nr:hypothetical protein T11_14552 [Trichinella zimbabwensis]